jgi:site-specific recombinase XerD
MKIELYRESGVPVNLEDREKYDTEFKLVFDKVEEKVNKLFEKTASNPKNRLFKVPKMIMFQRFMNYAERQLAKKHNKLITIDLPKTQKGFVELLNKYENVPIMIALEKKGEKVVGILLDRYGRF